MTIASNLQRIIDAKAAIKAAIIEKGVEVPDDEKLDTYYSYIDQIVGTPDIFEPDLSQPLDQVQLENLQNIVAAGKASEYLNTGDELLVSYGDYTMPFEVVGFEDVEVEGGETKPSINLLAKYTDETGSVYGTSNTTKYSASTLRSNITTTYQNKISTDFLACLANTKTQTYYADSIDIVYDKLFAPSMAQLGVTDTNYNNASQAAVEGPTFPAYQGSDDAKRIKQSIKSGVTVYGYWMRTFYAANNRFGCIFRNGAPTADAYSSNNYVVVAGNFIGK